MKLKKEVRKQMKRSIIATILAATVLISMAGMASASVWNLHNDSTMHQDSFGSGDVSIPVGCSNVWRTADVTSNTCFTGLSMTMLNSNTVDCNVSIGYCDVNGTNFVLQAYMDKCDPNSTYAYSTVTDVTVPIDQYLAINVTNNGEVPLMVYTTIGSLLLHTGATYPAPELATIALVGIGLIGLVALGRRRT